MGRTLVRARRLVPAVLVGMALGTAGAAAGGLPTTDFGANVTPYTASGQMGPGNLAAGSSAGLGLARAEVTAGGDADPLVALLASAHLHLYPVMSVSCPSGTACSEETSPQPATAASEMSQFIAAFAQRYGPGGTFWAQNPSLPYEPVQRFEIGDEPNIPVYWVKDSTHLHWSDPSSYAQVYEAARSSLHAVDPSGVAVVGGLADSASGGVDVQSDEEWLAALTPGAVDAVGYHPWVFDVSDSLLTTDTQELRSWMDGHGFGAVPLDVNEFGACDPTPESGAVDSECTKPESSASWGNVVSSYTAWAMCTPGLGVADIQPFWWGGTATTDDTVWLPITGSDEALTPFGQEWLAEVRTLTTMGCSTSSSTTTAPPPTTGSRSGVTHPLKSMAIRIMSVRRRGRAVTVTIRHAKNAGRLVVTASRAHTRRHRSLVQRSRGPRTSVFTATLSAGRWTITVMGKPTSGYAAPPWQTRKVRVP